MTPTKIFETSIEGGGTRFTLNNARPKGMRVLVMIFAPIIIGIIGLTAVHDFSGGRWVMGLIRVGFAVIVGTATMFTLFGAEVLDIAGGEIVWTRGKNFERRAKVGDVQQLERQGNQLRVIVRDQPPIVVGAGLRQPPEAMSWLADRVEAVIKALPAARPEPKSKSKPKSN